MAQLNSINNLSKCILFRLSINQHLLSKYESKRSGVFNQVPDKNLT